MLIFIKHLEHRLSIILMHWLFSYKFKVSRTRFFKSPRHVWHMMCLFRKGKLLTELKNTSKDSKLEVLLCKNMLWAQSDHFRWVERKTWKFWISEIKNLMALFMKNKHENWIKCSRLSRMRLMIIIELPLDTLYIREILIY